MAFYPSVKTPRTSTYELAQQMAQGGSASMTPAMVPSSSVESSSLPSTAPADYSVYNPQSYEDLSKKTLAGLFGADEANFWGNADVVKQWDGTSDMTQWLEADMRPTVNPDDWLKQQKAYNATLLPMPLEAELPMSEEAMATKYAELEKIYNDLPRYYEYGDPSPANRGGPYAKIYNKYFDPSIGGMRTPTYTELLEQVIRGGQGSGSSEGLMGYAAQYMPNDNWTGKGMTNFFGYPENVWNNYLNYAFPNTPQGKTGIGTPYTYTDIPRENLGDLGKMIYERNAGFYGSQSNESSATGWMSKDVAPVLNAILSAIAMGYIAPVLAAPIAASFSGGGTGAAISTLGTAMGVTPEMAGTLPAAGAATGALTGGGMGVAASDIAGRATVNTLAGALRNPSNPLKGGIMGLGNTLIGAGVNEVFPVPQVPTGTPLVNLPQDADMQTFLNAALSSGEGAMKQAMTPEFWMNRIASQLGQEILGEGVKAVMPSDRDAVLQNYFKQFTRQQQLQDQTTPTDTGSSEANAELIDRNVNYNPEVSSPVAAPSYFNQMFNAYIQAMNEKPDYGVSRNRSAYNDYITALRQMGIQ